MKKLDPVRRTILLFTFSFIAIGTLVGVLTSRNGIWHDFSTDVYITGLSICESTNPNSIISEDANPVISDTYSQVYACGYLHSKKEATLNAYLYKNLEDSPVSIYTSDLLGEGYFAIPILLPEENRMGNYHLEIYFFRGNLASLSIEVSHP